MQAANSPRHPVGHVVNCHMHHKLLAGLALLCLLLTAVATTVVGAAEASDTMSIVKPGEEVSNVEIAVRLSEETPRDEAPDAVLIARDDVFADAMAGGVLQGAYPLLLVPPHGPIPDRVREHLAELGVRRAILLGGVNAVGVEVEDALRGLGLTVERREGQSRFDTAVDVARTDAAGSTTFIIARAFGVDGDPTAAFADSLAAGGMAADHGWPILLTESHVLSGPTLRYLEAHPDADVVLMGGEAAISAEVEEQIRQITRGTVERLQGADRFETATVTAEKRGDASAADADHVVLVDGEGPNAWAGGFAAAHYSAAVDGPIILSGEHGLNPATVAWLQGDDAGFAVDPGDVEGIVLTCVTRQPQPCEQARTALGLPALVTVGFAPFAGSEVPAGEPVAIQVTSGVEGLTGDVDVTGPCVGDTSLELEDAIARVTISADADPGPCLLTWTLHAAGGTFQVESVTYQVVEPTTPPGPTPPPPPSLVARFLWVPHSSQLPYHFTPVVFDASSSVYPDGTTFHWTFEAPTTTRQTAGSFVIVDDDPLLDGFNAADPPEVAPPTPLQDPGILLDTAGEWLVTLSLNGRTTGPATLTQTVEVFLD